MNRLGGFLHKRNPDAEFRLDIDDVESDNWRRIGRLCQASGFRKHAIEFCAEARKYKKLEASVLNHFDQVFVCSRVDQEKLSALHGLTNVSVLPNTVEIPHSVGAPKPHTGPCSLLFVGSLGYLPNHDAVSFFCSDVLPLMRREMAEPFITRIVGTGTTASFIEELKCFRGVEVVGPVPDVTPYYESADIVIVPLRAGGGTRIKILEAFSHQRPVVSTPIGIEGIDAVHEVHALVADCPDLFAKECVRLMRDFALRVTLAQNAADLVRANYSDCALRASLFAADQRRDLVAQQR